MSREYPLKLFGDSRPKPRKVVDFVCETCGITFQKEFWYIKKGRRFCSHACRKKPLMQRLMERIEKQANGCWNWTGVIDFGGYGQITVDGITRNVHRVMWAVVHNKPIPDGMVIRHKCIGNRRCVNPEHLLLGTQQDNIDDMKRQGRFRTASPAQRIFPVEVVRGMRKVRSETGMSYKKMAKLFNTGCGAIWQIVNFKTYKDVK